MSGEVWIIESGEYSDYGVSAVCATEAEAKAVCDRWNLLDNRPESAYDRFTYSRRPIITADDVQLMNRYTIHDDGTVNPNIRTVVTIYANQVDYAYVSAIGVYADSPERARKIAQDYRARQAAEAAGIT